MMSSATQLVKRLLHPSSHSFKPPLDNVRYYAAYSVNKPNPLNTDPQALSNNPVVKTGSKMVQHNELHRTRCSYPGCNGLYCIGLCLPPLVDRKAIAHGTHGKAPATETDKKTVEVSETDFDGKNKPQKMVFYKKPHDTTETPEDVQATKKINNEPNIQALIKHHEDKK